MCFVHFDFQKVLLATAACNFSTSELQKVVPKRGVLYILTCKCAFRHSGVQFLDIRTSKSAPNLMCFVHFDFKCAFRHSGVQFLNEHQNFRMCKKCFEPERVLYILTSKCAFRHSGVQFFDIWTSKSGPKHDGVLYIFTCQNVLFATAACNFWFLLWPPDLRTRRFNRPTFRLTRHTNHWKNTAFRDFSNIWRGCIFFLLTFALLHLLVWLTWLYCWAMHLLFNCPYCRKFLFKLPYTQWLDPTKISKLPKVTTCFVGKKQHMLMWFSGGHPIDTMSTASGILLWYSLMALKG